MEGNSIHNIAETVIGATLSLENKQRWAAYGVNVSQEFYITPTQKTAYLLSQQTYQFRQHFLSSIEILLE